jgi:uncharacterized membrane-anchored protein YitT (DUF2179 family)
MYLDRVKIYINNSRSIELPLYFRVLLVFLGASCVAISLELFLVKNYVIDGGIVGISIILSYVTNLEVGLLLLVLNIPFLLIGYSYLGRKFLGLSLFAIFVLSIGMHILKPFPALTNNPLLVIILGGIILGIGVGVIIRFGGCLDGTEVMAILFSQRSIFSVGQYVMLFNFFIFGSSILIFGMKEPIYSLATFLVACKIIDFTVKS